MIIYNVTINVDDRIHDKWMDWIKKHILKVLATGKFVEARFAKVLVNEEMGGTTYSIQYKAKSKADLEKYYSQDAEKLRHEGERLFADNMLAFRTELEIIDEYSVSFN